MKSRFKKGDKCPSGGKIDEILGQSSEFCVYTTDHNAIRWDCAVEPTPQNVADAIGEFDERVTQLKSIDGITSKRALYEFLGKCLFRAVENGCGPQSYKAFKKYDAYVYQAAGRSGVLPRVNHASKNVFIIHGHDKSAKHEVARLVDVLGYNPVILHEQPDRGKTVIEKFESNADARFAIVLLTPDDLGKSITSRAKSMRRARQNVVFEFGFFVAALGRANCVALKKGELEVPSDYSGVIIHQMDDGGAWKLHLAKEMKNCGMEIDLNHLT